MPNRPATLSIRRRRNPPYFWAKQLIVLIAELDYHLEHNFGHGDKYLSEAFFVLNLLAYFIHQIFELVDGLYQQVRAGFGARREFWGAVRATFRLFLFPSWDQVLVRMNSPPQSLSG